MLERLVRSDVLQLPLFQQSGLKNPALSKREPVVPGTGRRPRQ